MALLNVALVGEPIFGGAFLRSVDLADDAAARGRFRRYLVEELARVLEDA